MTADTVERKEPLDLPRYLTRVAKEQTRHPELRRGQAMYIVLHHMRPDLVEEIKGTDLDPFYAGNSGEPRMLGFLDWLMDKAHKEDI